MAMALESQQRTYQSRFPRIPAKFEGQDEEPPVDLDEVKVWDLLNAFGRLMKEGGGRRAMHEITYDDTPIDLPAADIEDRLNREGRLTLSALIIGRKSRSEMIGVFLALLELIRQKKILVHQSETIGDIDIEPAPEEHRRLKTQATMHLALADERVEDATFEPDAATEEPDLAEPAPEADTPAPGAT